MLRSVLAASVLALNAPPPALPADYQMCTPVDPGPIERPDHYSAHPYGTRKADLA